VLELSTEQFFAALVLSTILALVVFRHAERHGNQRATAWGIAAFFFGVFATAVYFARFYLRRVNT
jgi:hypothetical protein